MTIVLNDEAEGAGEFVATLRSRLRHPQYQRLLIRFGVRVEVEPDGGGAGG